MKTLLLTCAIFLPWCVFAQYEDVQEFRLSAEDIEVLHIHNHRGNINVQGSNLDVIQITVTRRLRNAAKNRLTEMKEKIFIDSVSNGGHLYFFMESPDRNFSIDPDGQGYYEGINWSGNWNKSHFKTQYEFIWEVQLPTQLSLAISNHHESIRVENMTGSLRVKNHHDDVKVIGAGGNVLARTHHGDVKVSFVKHPPDEVEGHTHHGDIFIEAPFALSADVSLKSHHGSFFTDFDWQNLPMQVSEENKSDGIKYRVADRTNVRLGSGDIKMNFKTHHGDVYIRRNI